MTNIDMTNKYSFFKELKQRWKEPLSKFWDTLLHISVWVGTSAVAIIGADKMFDLQTSYGVSPILFTICGYVIVFCFGLGLASKITVKHPEEFNND